jgi:hypothetical protein
MFDYLVGERRRLRRGIRAFVREVEVDDVRVFVDHGFQWDGSANVWLTRARASFVVGAGPAFDVRPRGTIARAVGYLGGVSCGDPCFDYFFAARTPEPDHTWAALTTRSRSLLAGELDDARLESDGRMVTMWREGDFGREADAAIAIEIVQEIAGYRRDALDALRRLPGAVHRPAHGAWDQRVPPTVELALPRLVRIGPIGHRGRPVTAIRSACGRATAPFVVDLDQPTPGASPAVAELPHRLRDAVHEIGASGLACDGSEITLRWPVLETRREPLLSGAELVGRIAVELGGGVYR